MLKFVIINMLMTPHLQFNNASKVGLSHLICLRLTSEPKSTDCLWSRLDSRSKYILQTPSDGASVALKHHSKKKINERDGASVYLPENAIKQNITLLLNVVCSYVSFYLQIITIALL